MIRYYKTTLRFPRIRWYSHDPPILPIFHGEVRISAIDNFLTPEECRSWITWGEKHGFEEAKQKQNSVYAHRDNGRIEFNSCRGSHILNHIFVWNINYIVEICWNYIQCQPLLRWVSMQRFVLMFVGQGQRQNNDLQRQCLHLQSFDKSNNIKMYGSVSKPWYPSERQNSWDLWMFIPLNVSNRYWPIPIWFPKFKISDFSRPYLINLRLRHRLPTLVAHQGFRAGDRGPKSPGAGAVPRGSGSIATSRASASDSTWTVPGTSWSWEVAHTSRCWCIWMVGKGIKRSRWGQRFDDFWWILMVIFLGPHVFTMSGQWWSVQLRLIISIF